MTSPAVSVIVPVFNAERYLAGALDSIYDQAYEPLEVVVIDDGSTDRSVEIARSYPVRLLREPHGGPSKARNAGIDAASAELIAFLDADDLWTPGSLTRRVERMVERPELDAVFGMMEIFVDPGVEPPPWYRGTWEVEPQHSLLGGWLVRRRVFEQVGAFDPAFEIGHDTDWFARFKDAHLCHERLPDVLMRYRLHTTNTSSRRELVGRELVMALKQSVDRQRRGDA